MTTESDLAEIEKAFDEAGSEEEYAPPPLVEMYSSSRTPSLVAKELVNNHFTTEHKTPNLVSYKDNWYKLREGGEWEKVNAGDWTSRRWVGAEIGDRLGRAVDPDGNGWPTTQSNVNNVAAFVESQLMVPPSAELPVFLSFDPDGDRLISKSVGGVPVAFNDGVVDALTGQFTPAGPGYFTTSRVNCDYDPEAKAEKFEDMLEQLFGGMPNTITAAKQLLGLHLAGLSGQQAIFCLTGAPGSGKSQYTDVLKNIKTEGAVAETSIATLNGTHGTAPLVGKSLVVLSDMAEQVRAGAVATSILKNISGGDEISINEKNKPVTSARIHAQILMVSNHTPGFSDDSGAMDSRMRYLKAVGPNMRESAKQVPNLGQRLAKDETAGIANLALSALQDMHELDSLGGDKFRIAESEAQAEVARESTVRSNKVLFLLDEMEYELTGDKNDTVNQTELLKMMKLEADNYRLELGKWSPSARKIEDALRNEPLGVGCHRPRVDGTRTRVIYGVRLRSDVSTELAEVRHLHSEK